MSIPSNFGQNFSCHTHSMGTNGLQSSSKRTEPKLVISIAEWAGLRTIELPPYPQELQDFLAGDCPFWPGKTKAETHLVVPLFPQVDLDGTPVPLTLETLHKLDRASGGFGFKRIWDHVPRNISAQPEFLYGVITKDVIPGTMPHRYETQIQLLPDGYKAPSALDAARALFWWKRSSEKDLFKESEGFTICEDVILGHHVMVGGTSSHSLVVDWDSLSGGAGVGIAGWRTFKL